MVSNCELSSCLCLFAIVRCVVAMIFMTHIMSMLEKHAEIPNKRDQIARNVEKVIRDETRVQFERLDSTRKLHTNKHKQSVVYRWMQIDVDVLHRPVFVVTVIIRLLQMQCLYKYEHWKKEKQTKQAASQDRATNTAHAEEAVGRQQTKTIHIDREIKVKADNSPRYMT